MAYSHYSGNEQFFFELHPPSVAFLFAFRDQPHFFKEIEILVEMSVHAEFRHIGTVGREVQNNFMICLFATQRITHFLIPLAESLFSILDLT